MRTYELVCLLNIQAWFTCEKALKKFVTTIQLNDRSLPSVPGFLLLSLALFGLKQRTEGKLATLLAIIFFPQKPVQKDTSV